MAAALIQKQTHPAVLSHEHIRQAVVVDVANRHAHAVTRHVQSRTGADVGKFPVRPLMKQFVLRSGFRTAILDEINVQPPVVVVIEQGRAGADRLGHEETAQRPGIMGEVQA